MKSGGFHVDFMNVKSKDPLARNCNPMFLNFDIITVFSTLALTFHFQAIACPTRSKLSIKKKIAYGCVRKVFLMSERSYVLRSTVLMQLHIPLCTLYIPKRFLQRFDGTCSFALLCS